MYRQDSWFNGKRKAGKTITEDIARLRKWLDNLESDWRKNMMPMVKPGEFDPNNASEVTRLSPDELLVVTTGAHKLRFLNVELKPPQPAR